MVMAIMKEEQAGQMEDLVLPGKRRSTWRQVPQSRLEKSTKAVPGTRLSLAWKPNSSIGVKVARFIDR